MSVCIEQITVAADPGAWSDLGFTVTDDVCILGTTPVRLARASERGGITGWTLSGLTSTELDGLPTTAGSPTQPAATAHPNGVTSLDHVVAFTPDRDRTSAALQAAGLDLRREVEGLGPTRPMRFAFFRCGDVIVEIAEPPDLAAKPERPARFWGLAVVVDDLDAVVASLGPERCGEARDAVQPGRRIAPLRREAGAGVPIAFMTPGARAA